MSNQVQRLAETHVIQPPTLVTAKGRFTEPGGPTREAQISLDDRGIVIAGDAGEKPLVWPYGALQSDERLTAQSVSALITYRHQPGASLFVPNPAFARALATAAPHLAQRAQMRTWASRAGWTLAALSTVALIIWLAGFSPSRAIAERLPDSLRDSMGQQALESIAESRRVCIAGDGTAALDALAAQLSKATGTAKSFKITVLDWDLVNALAVPGEYILLTKALIDQASGPDELAGVLAHEMGHGLELHNETAMVRAIGLGAAVELLIGGGGLANIGLTLAQLSYSREAEHEADQQALNILKKAEISQRGMSAFFERMIALEKREQDTPSIGSVKVFRTHPATDERRTRIAATPDYPATYALNAGQWAALKTICSATKSFDEVSKSQDGKDKER